MAFIHSPVELVQSETDDAQLFLAHSRYIMYIPHDPALDYAHCPSVVKLMFQLIKASAYPLLVEIQKSGTT
jgi:hypothetical protein